MVVEVVGVVVVVHPLVLLRDGLIRNWGSQTVIRCSVWAVDNNKMDP